MPSRTWTRIALSYAVLLLLTGAVLGIVLGDEFESRAEEALRLQLGDEARAVAERVAPLLAGGAPISDTTALAHEYSRLFGTRVTIIRPDGVVVGDSEEDPARMENHSTRAEVLAALASPGSLGSSSRLSATVHRRLLYVAVTVPDPSNPPHVLGLARVAYSMAAVEEARNALYQGIAIALLVVITLAALLGVVLARSVAGPVSELRGVAARFGRGELTARAPITVGGEIGELGRDLNSMADRLSTVIRQRTVERNRMAAVLDHMYDAIIITDGQGRIESLNPPAARLFGGSPEAAVGRTIIETTRSPELHRALAGALAEPVQRSRFEFEHEPYNLLAVVTAVPPTEGESGTGLIVLQDITELRRLERVRRDFVANIGHELRTPLASVKLLVETLGIAVRDDPEAAEQFLKRIDVEVDGLTQLVRELLELSGIESGSVELKRRAVDVPGLLEGAAARLGQQAERAGLDVTVECEPGLPLAWVDPDRVEQVLVNLMHNSIKFTEPGGHIVLRASRDPLGVLVNVRDTGAGIPEEDLPRIFERFYKVDKARVGASGGEGGTGLGLAIAKHIVQAHGGSIWAESRPGEGTTLSFTLPAAGR